MQKELKKSNGRNAMVSTARVEASKIGVDILQQGGNAVDAAVAVGFALGVCEPSTSGLGGGGFMMIKAAGQEEPVLLDFREYAPHLASRDMWELDENGKPKDRQHAVGGKSVAVPGEVAGLLMALNQYGTMSKKDVIEPAAELAERGIVVTQMMEDHFTKNAETLKRWKGGRQLYLEQNRIQKGKIFKNPALAATLRQIAREPDNWFYEGSMAERILAAVQESGGILDAEDMKNYRPAIRRPVYGTYRGYQIYSSNLPSSGGTHIIQTLNMLEHFDVGSMEVNSPEYIHLFSEIFKKVYGDRAKYMADSNFYPVPVNGMISKKYADELVKQIDTSRCGGSSAGDPWIYEHDDTTHYSIGDKDGNMVSVTKTINHFCGACVVPEGTGFLLNDTMADFSVMRDSINAAEANKKPLSTMSPTIILKDGKPYAIVGSPGGARIICNVVQVISKLIDHNMGMDEAIDSPRITEDTKCRVMMEGRISPETAAELEKMGHQIETVLDYDVKMGGVQGVLYLPDGTIQGSADPRRDGIALGY